MAGKALKQGKTILDFSLTSDPVVRFSAEPGMSYSLTDPATGKLLEPKKVQQVLRSLEITLPDGRLVVLDDFFTTVLNAEGAPLLQAQSEFVFFTGPGATPYWVVDPLANLAEWTLETGTQIWPSQDLLGIPQWMNAQGLTASALIAPPVGALIVEATLGAGLLGPLGGLGLLAAASGGGGAAALVDIPSLFVTYSGTVGLGPVIAGNDLVVNAYDAAGNILGTDTEIDPVLGYSIQVRASYTGAVVVRVESAGVKADFFDENTKLATNLASSGAKQNLHAVTVAKGTSLIANISSLTDLAARKVIDTSSTANTKLIQGVTIADVNAINTAVATKFLGLNADITTQGIKFTISATGADTSGAANRYGQVLKQLSDLAAAKGGDINAAQASLAAQVNWSPGQAAAAATLATQAVQTSLLAKVALNAKATDTLSVADKLTVADLPGLVTNAAELTAPRQAQLVAKIIGKGDAAPLTLAELQASSNVILSTGKILDLADNIPGTPIPTVKDYETAGITGVNAANVEKANANIAASKSADLPSTTDIETVALANLVPQGTQPIPVSGLNGITTLDVQSDLVVNFASAINLTPNSAIKLRVVSSSSARSFSVDLTDTTQVTLSADGKSLVINPKGDLDFGGSYHIEVDAGAFISRVNPSGTPTSLAYSNLATFSTVAASKLGTLSQKMTGAGGLVASQTFMDITGVGNTDTVDTSINMGTGNITLVYKDGNPLGGNSSTTGIGTGTVGFNLQVKNWALGDFLYFDDLAALPNTGSANKIESYGGLQDGNIFNNSATQATQVPNFVGLLQIDPGGVGMPHAWIGIGVATPGYGGLDGAAFKNAVISG